MSCQDSSLMTLLTELTSQIADQLELRMPSGLLELGDPIERAKQDLNSDRETEMLRGHRAALNLFTQRIQSPVAAPMQAEPQSLVVKDRLMNSRTAKNLACSAI